MEKFLVIRSEDEYTLVFMDVAKDIDGHMLAIPKNMLKAY